MKTCSECGAVMEDELTVCPECGASVQAPKINKEAKKNRVRLVESYGRTFLNSYLGLALCVVLIAVPVLIFVFYPNIGMIIGQAGSSWAQTTWSQIIVFALMCFGAVLTARSRGLDLSLSAIMGMGGMIFVLNPTAGGLALSVFICAAIGAFNGVIICFARLNALIATILTGTVLRALLTMFTGGSPVVLPGQTVNLSFWALIAVGALLAAASIVFLCFTAVGSPMFKRTFEDKEGNRLAYASAYALSGFMAGFSGIFICYMMGGFIYTVALPMDNELLIIYVALAVCSSRLFDNRIMPVFVAFAMCVSYAFLRMTMSLYVPSADAFNLVLAAISLVFLAVCAVSRREWHPKANETKLTTEEMNAMIDEAFAEEELKIHGSQEKPES